MFDVVQWATGNVGREAAAAVHRHTGLHLVGALVYDDAKAGHDVGELCGLEPFGVTATTDRDAILALDADCALYMAQGEMNPAGALDDIPSVRVVHTEAPERQGSVLRIADQEMDTFLPLGTCEFIGEYAAPFTMLVIADLLGVPQFDLPRFRQFFEGNHDFGDLDKHALHQHLTDTSEENTLGFFETTFTRYIDERRQRPRNDVLNHLAEVRFPDGSVPDTTILANEAAFLFAAGQETTTRSLAFAVKSLADNDRLQEQLREQRDLIPAFVEETFRLESPVKDHFRMARRTVTLGGVDIPAGTSVMLLIGAINRDPRAFDDADALRLDRRNRYEHVAFARGGHTCLGQQLARIEMRTSIRQQREVTPRGRHEAASRRLGAPSR